MLLTKRQEIAGRPATHVRAIARTLGEDQWSDGLLTELVVERFGVDEDTARRFLHELEALDFLEHGDLGIGPYRWKPHEDGAMSYWRTTTKGNALAKAKVGTPMPRAKAQAVLDEFLDRVVTMNARSDEIYVVDEVRLYGSFADDSRELVGDVDLWVHLARRNPATIRDDIDRKIREGIAAGKNVTQGVMQPLWPQADFCRRLAGRSPKLDIEWDTPLIDPSARIIYSIYSIQHQAIDA